MTGTAPKPTDGVGRVPVRGLRFLLLGMALGAVLWIVIILVLWGLLL